MDRLNDVAHLDILSHRGNGAYGLWTEREREREKANGGSKQVEYGGLNLGFNNVLNVLPRVASPWGDP